MIALETTAKIGKSPKKPQEFEEESEDDEEESEEENDGVSNESEAYELESADEGCRENEFDEDDNENDSDNKDIKVVGNHGWADVMQKILRTKKPKRKKTIVLSKAKKLCDVVKKEKEEDIPFEIDKVKDEPETVDSKESIEKPTTHPKRRRKDNLGIRVKPSITDRERERLLQKIATKGVVQLFNAVKQQQGEINKKLSDAGPLERKREKVLKSIDKRTFLDVLMGGSKSIAVNDSAKIEEEQNQTKGKKDDSGWNVLREDFVMGAKLKDWDRKNEEQDSSAPEDMDSDD